MLPNQCEVYAAIEYDSYLHENLFKTLGSFSHCVPTYHLVNKNGNSSAASL